MSYETGLTACDGSASLPMGGREPLHTFASVEAALVEAMRLWWRSPGAGRWPFAADAPWHLMTRKTRISEGGFKGRDLQLRMQAEDAEEAKRMEGRERKGSLSRDEVALRDATTEWLGLVGDDSRKVVVAALVQLAAGRTNIDWRRVKVALGIEIGTKGVYRRYSRAIAGIADALNAGKLAVR